jgi:hypothetical protein
LVWGRVSVGPGVGDGWGRVSICGGAMRREGVGYGAGVGELGISSGLAPGGRLVSCAATPLCGRVSVGPGDGCGRVSIDGGAMRREGFGSGAGVGALDGVGMSSGLTGPYVASCARTVPSCESAAPLGFVGPKGALELEPHAAAAEPSAAMMIMDRLRDRIFLLAS